GGEGGPETWFATPRAGRPPVPPLPFTPVPPVRCTELFDSDLRAETLEDLGADALDGVEVVDAFEGALRGSVVEDALGESGADAREEFEFALCGGVDVDEFAERRGGAGGLDGFVGDGGGRSRGRRGDN